jgi:hypothetical protein
MASLGYFERYSRRKRAESAEPGETERTLGLAAVEDRIERLENSIAKYDLFGDKIEQLTALIS